MRKFLTIAAVTSAIALGGCNPAVNAGAQTAATIAQVQRVAAQVCGYLPAVSTITGVLRVFVAQAGSYIDIANQVATAICSAIPPRGALGVKRGGVVGVLYGVPIRGRYLRR